MNLTPVILAGGKSLRFKGKQKALLKIDGVRLIDIISNSLKTLSSNLILITNKPSLYSFFPGRIYKDIVPSRGPISGLYTALHFSLTDYIFLIGCDMPFVNIELIRFMNRIRKSYEAVVPNVNGKIEPLYAIYHKNIKKKVLKLITEKHYSLHNLIKNIKTKFIEKRMVEKFDNTLMCFKNINRYKDL